MLNYQSTSFHDALAVRKLFNLKPAPEFLAMATGDGNFSGQRAGVGERQNAPAIDGTL